MDSSNRVEVNTSVKPASGSLSSTAGSFSAGLSGWRSLLESRTVPVTEITDDFYSDCVNRILPFCGNEYLAADYSFGLESLNERLHLGLGEEQRKVLSLMLTGLSQTSRFGSEIHLPGHLGENSAVHCCHTAILFNELVRRAELLDYQSIDIIDMRISGSLQGLVHDMGEILGEFSSLAQRVGSDLSEDPMLEKDIFEAFVREGYQAVLDSRPDNFYRKLKELRDAAGITTGEKNPGEHGIQAMVQESLELKFPALIEEEVALLLTVFDLAEMHDESSMSPSDVFLGNVIKATEHMQGTRHILRFGSKGEGYWRLDLFHNQPVQLEEEYLVADPETVPLDLMPGYRLFGGLKYLESEVSAVNANADSEAEKLLAREVTKAIYSTSIEYLHAACRYVDRKATGLPEGVSELVKDIFEPGLSRDKKISKVEAVKFILEKDQERLAGLFQAQMAGVSEGEAGTRLFPVESAERLMSVYKHAIDTEFKAPEGLACLATIEELPEDLQGFSLIDWNEYNPVRGEE